jgi:uncharacterized membrane protein
VKLLSFVLMFAGCSGAGDGDGGPGPADPTTVEEGPAICADAPVVTWDNFGAGFLTQHCDACHLSTTLDRHDAPADVVFDTEEDVWAYADRILVRAAGDEPTMPPQGGVSVDDRYLLEVWLTCGG